MDGNEAFHVFRWIHSLIRLAQKISHVMIEKLMRMRRHVHDAMFISRSTTCSL